MATLLPQRFGLQVECRVVTLIRIPRVLQVCVSKSFIDHHFDAISVPGTRYGVTFRVFGSIVFAWYVEKLHWRLS